MTFQPDLKLRTKAIDITICSQGYEILSKRDHKRGPIYIHTLIAEQMYGGPLRGLSVHHLDGNKRNNKPVNLMLCEHSYHRMQHKRMDALEACGVSWYLKCPFCKKYDNPKDMYVRSYKGRIDTGRHRECVRIDQRERYQADPEKVCARQRKYHTQRQRNV